MCMDVCVFSVLASVMTKINSLFEANLVNLLITSGNSSFTPVPVLADICITASKHDETTRVYY